MQIRFQARIVRSCSSYLTFCFPLYILNFISFHFQSYLCSSFVVNFSFEENHTWVELSGIECTYYFYVFVRKINPSIFTNVCNIDMIVLIDRLSYLSINQLINECSRPLPQPGTLNSVRFASAGITCRGHIFTSVICDKGYFLIFLRCVRITCSNFSGLVMFVGETWTCFAQILHRFLFYR